MAKKPSGKKARKAAAPKAARPRAGSSARSRGGASRPAVRASSTSRGGPRVSLAPNPPILVNEPIEPMVGADSGLSAADLEGFRAMLLEKRRELMGDVGRLQDEALSKNRQDASGDLSNMPIHMADIGSDNYEQELTLGLIEGERALLREIEEALRRIDAGTFGICAATGRPIGKARLKATPWAKYCYEYMLAQEQRQRRGFL